MSRRIAAFFDVVNFENGGKSRRIVSFSILQVDR